MIKEDFLSVLENYEIESSEYNKKLNERKELKKKGELSPKDNLSQDSFLTATLLKNRLPEEVRKLARLGSYLKVQGSAGMGYMPEIPHVCIFDSAITTSAQKGYYIVYLFHSSSRHVYLSLNQGFTEYRKEFGNKVGKRKARENAMLAQKLLRSAEGFDFGPLPWQTTGDLAEGYKNGTICFKKYNVDNFPDDIQFVDDLRNLIGIYRELKGLVGNSIFQIKAAISESDYQDQIQSKVGIALPDGPIPFNSKEFIVQQKKTTSRDERVSSQAIINASYHCENNPEHETFTHVSGHKFVEAHHLIPLEFQKDFISKLDVPENVLSLCPNCHRAFHHSNFSTRKTLIAKFWNARKQHLVERGIFVPLEVLIHYYNISEIEQEIPD